MAYQNASGSICLKRTRKRLANLIWAALFLFAAIALLAYAVSAWTSDRSYWEGMDWVTAIVSTGLGLAALTAGLYEAVTSVRDALFPARSRLAKSIRAQLSYPEEDIPTSDLFAMVDRDISENGVWFDRVAVGREWILGDDATYIPRIRAVFGRDEIQRRRVNGRNIQSEVVQLYIIDDRKQVQVTGLKNPNELQQLLECLRLRAPDALFLPYKEFLDYAAKTQEEWDALDREYRARKANREMHTPAPKVSERQSMVFTRPDGTDTSRVTEDMVTAALRGALRSDDWVLFTLAPTVPYAADGIKLAFLQCAAVGVDDPDFDEDDLKDEAEIYLITGVKPEPGHSPESGFLLDCAYDEAEQVLLDWFHGQVPDVSEWMPIDIRVWTPPQKKPDPQPPKLVLQSASGVLQSHESFEREDVEAAADGLRDGTYKLVELTLPGGYLMFRVEPNDKTDDQSTATATADRDGKLRFYTRKCSQRQVAGWLLDYYDGKFRPTKPEWKDITRKIYKQMGV